MLAGALLNGCATERDAHIPPTPMRPFVVPDALFYGNAAAVAPAPGAAAPGGAAPGAADAPARGAPGIDPAKTYELAELIDIAQRTNPDTRIAWERAREAAIAGGMAEAAYAPMLSAKAAAGFQHVSSPLPKTLAPEGFTVADTQAFLPSLTLKWLLFDFGGKQAAADAARESLAAANFGFNATHERIVFGVTRAYYTLNAVQGRTDVARASLEQAQTLQAAAESRRARGLATLPEVLQAREQTARAAYELQEALAAETDARMALLEAMGVRPTAPLRVAGLAGRELPASTEATADKLADRALAQRPDLLARVAVVRAREAEVRKAQAEFYPRIVLAGDLGQNIGRVRTDGIPGWSRVNEPAYGAALAIELPLFDGGLRRDRVDAARAQHRIAEEELELARDQAVRQVVKAYEDFKVALSRREAAIALLTAAQESYAASIDSYRNGVATFVDVTNAQTALTKARTADTETRSNSFTVAAALAFSTGDLAAPAGTTR
jgi:outer membrane protein TolC